jgi:hypothetical protein
VVVEEEEPAALAQLPPCVLSTPAVLSTGWLTQALQQAQNRSFHEEDVLDTESMLEEAARVSEAGACHAR